MPNTTAVALRNNIFDRLILNFGQPIGKVEPSSYTGLQREATVFWAPCDYWNQALLRHWLDFPVEIKGPMMGSDVPLECKPADGGFMVCLMQ